MHAVAEAMIMALGRGRLVLRADAGAPHEVRLLPVIWAKARKVFEGQLHLDFDEAIRHRPDWYMA